jgi:hypothetical protein
MGQEEPVAETARDLGLNVNTLHNLDQQIQPTRRAGQGRAY